MNQKIVIIGAGEIGRAIGYILKDRQNIEIDFWDKDETKVSSQKSLSNIIPSADFVFICVPSWFVKNVLEKISPLLDKETIIVSLSKGIDRETKKTIDEILIDFTENSFALIYGPMIAEELMKGLQTKVIVSSKNDNTLEKVIKLFSETVLSLEKFSDIHGVAVSGVLKNIYSIGLGIVDALDLGTNFKGYFVQQSIKEMMEILKLLGGEKETVFSLAGLGDLVATGFNPYSRNYSVGKEIVKTGEYCLEGEGSISLPSIVDLLGKEVKKFPILNALENILLKKEDAKTIFQNVIKYSL